MTKKNKKYCVPILYTGYLNYIVEAEDVVEAEILARAKFGNGDDGDIPAIEEEKIDRVGEIEEIDRYNRIIIDEKNIDSKE